MSLDLNSPSDHSHSRSGRTSAGSSAQRSDRMSRTPSSTAATVVKSSPPSPFSALTKAAASSGGIERRVGEQPVGQRLDAGFARDLALGAALGLVRQVQVLQFLLGGRGLDRRAQLRA